MAMSLMALVRCEAVMVPLANCLLISASLSVGKGPETWTMDDTPRDK